MEKIVQIYEALLADYGYQGWWPLLSHDGTNPTKTGSVAGYHPGDYSFPRNEAERFEICVGAILTQNTAWSNVEKALKRLAAKQVLNPARIFAMEHEALGALIQPAGYYNQKARKLREFAVFFMKLEGRIPARDELLGLWGIGPETADSMLLYAWKMPVFVVDAYTRRMFARLKLIEGDEDYDEIQAIFHANLQKDHKVFNEFHALIVEEEKRRRRR